MNKHRYDIRNNNTNTHISKHFKTNNADKNKHKCSIHHLRVQPIEYLGEDKTKDKSLRLFRENYWIKELRTMYPYGLNERSSDGDATKNIDNTYNTFNKLNRNKNRFSNLDMFKKNFSIFDPKKIIKSIKNIYWNNTYWIYNTLSLLNKLNNKQLKMIIKYININIKLLDININIYNIINDFIKYKLIFKYQKHNNKNTKNLPKLYCKLNYLDKKIENINLEHILYHKSIINLLPNYIKIKKPTIVYKYLPPIRNTIFNYKQIINTNINNYQNFKCTCAQSKFCNKDIGHIVTGDLDIIQDEKLKLLFSYGPSYRIPKKVKWKKILNEIESALDKCIINWSNKEGVVRQTFKEWKDAIIIRIKSKIAVLSKHNNKHKYKNNNHHKHTHNMPIFDEDEINKELLKIHDDYVVVNADKAGNNIIIVCKKYYLECIDKEFKINKNKNKNNKDNNKNNTYVRSKYKYDTIIKKHITYMNKHNINIDKKMLKLPDLYWIPKMHKIIPKSRYIAASNSCTTKPLSNIITICLKLIYNQHKKYCDAIYKYTGVNRMWIIDNSQTVLDQINNFNNDMKYKINNINTYDFSTLYTNIPHKQLKKEINWVIEKAFYNDKKKFIYVNRFKDKATWYKTNNSYRVSKDDLITHINFLIDNIYIDVGKNVFRQKIGIPMGTDCAPFLANLFLYALEFKFLEKLSKENIYLARKFSNSFRYIDDLLMFNNGRLMNIHKNKIYPKELILNKENKTNTNCNFLDININIKDNCIRNKIFTSLYDKRNDFKFNINNYPNLSGNIHFKRSHGIIISQLIRYSKICMNINDFIKNSRALIIKLKEQFFDESLLKKKVILFYNKYYHFIEKYNLSLKKILYLLF
jgi:hypothetical protein